MLTLPGHLISLPFREFASFHMVEVFVCFLWFLFYPDFVCLRFMISELSILCFIQGYGHYPYLSFTIFGNVFLYCREGSSKISGQNCCGAVARISNVPKFIGRLMQFWYTIYCREIQFRNRDAE